MITWFDMLVAEQRRRDRMFRSEHERLAHLVARDARTARPQIGRRVLASLGKILVSWGKQLQERYAALADASTACRPVPCGEHRQSPVT